jgi:hypothetical protein
MAQIRARPDEVVVRELKRLGEIHEPLRLGRDELRHGHTRSHRSIDVLQGVVVGAAQEADGVAAQPAVAREHVCLHELQHMSEMRIAVDLGDRSRDVEAPLAHRGFSLLAREADPTDARVRPRFPLGPVDRRTS